MSKDDPREWEVAQREDGPGAGRPHARRARTKFEPLPRDWEERSAELADTFLSLDDLQAEQRDVIRQFVHLCLRFAHMERRIQGEVIYDLSTHASVVRREHAGDLVHDAEELACAERENFEMPAGPIEDLADLLDDRGIKAIQWPVPQGLTRAGAFLFDAATGPALLSLAPPDSPAGRFILAHEYGHLLADVDPYENRFCLSSDDSASQAMGGGRLFEQGELPPARVGGFAVSEMRADLFARAFLMPAEHFLHSAKLFDVHPKALKLSRLADLAYYYGVESAAALHRLADLGLLPVTEARAIRAESDALDAKEASQRGVEEVCLDCAVHHPVRFVNLGMAMYLKRLVSLDQMATLLGIDRAAAKRFLTFAESHEPDDAGDHLHADDLDDERLRDDDSGDEAVRVDDRGDEHVGDRDEMGDGLEGRDVSDAMERDDTH
ncbi:MAG: ImmA/IrrE family metallo-endopeptidase [Candidatus Eisenbacteria bacterium]|nr:ImmA/IrrE family metallo-endopeptidase [Candidatus Eisenbacteria bacterium]